MMNLAMANENDDFEVIEVFAQNNLSKRLCEIGIYPKSLLKVIKNDISGPLIVEVKGSRFVLGRGQAQKIMVVGV